MGGVGSGNWYRWDKKTTTEACRRVDIRYMRRQGFLFPSTRGILSWTYRGKPDGYVNFIVEENALVLDYRFRQPGEDWQDVTERIPLEWTPCHYGGHRAWFRCPHCNRRVAVLYGGDHLFLCRHCYNLTYSSQQENRMNRLLSKAQDVRQRLGGTGSMGDLFPPKPKGMHWKTYRHLEAKDRIAENLFSVAMKCYLAKLEP